MKISRPKKIGNQGCRLFLRTSVTPYTVQRFFSLIEAEAIFNKLFLYTDLAVLSSIKSISTTFLSSSFVSSASSLRPSTSYSAPKPQENHLISLLHIINVCNDTSGMLHCTTNNEFPSQILRIYTESPVEFPIWRHENQVFWARLVQAFYDRLKSNKSELLSVDYEKREEDSLEDDQESESLIVPGWSVS